MEAITVAGGQARAREANADFKISLVRRSPRLSHPRRSSRSRSSVVSPGWRTVSTSVRRTHLRTVSGSTPACGP